MTQNTQSGRVADATDANWVDRFAPPAIRPYLRLSRADRPAGTWLLLLPCWWGAALGVAARGEGWDAASLWVMVGSAIGAFLMRGAGCTWNDFTDQEIDASVARTRSRPLPSGQVTQMQALIWMCLQALLAFGILLTFPPLAIWLGIGSLAIVAIYPFAKRFTWWPQVFLGLAFNWGALLAWAAVTETLSAAPILLYISGIAWTLFYDTIYAHQDREDDALIGVRSTARLFGEATPRWLFAFLIITVIAMAAAALIAVAPRFSPLVLGLAILAPWGMGWHLAWQLRALDINDAERCLKLFRSNRNAGLIPAIIFTVAGLITA